MRIKITGIRFGTLICDKNDLELYYQYNWFIYHEHRLISTSTPSVKFHRLVMNAPKGMEVDHINHNKLDNRKANLRIVTKGENGQNQPKRKNSTSIYYGIIKIGEKYQCTVNYLHTHIHIGIFDNELEAAVAYDMFLLKNKYEFKPLNFPEQKKIHINMIETYKFPEKKNQIQNQTSLYNGVIKSSGTYFARIKVNKKQLHILSSKDEKACAKAFDKYVIDNNLKNRKLNFPEDYPNYGKEKPIKTLCEHIDNKRVKLLINHPNRISDSIIDIEEYDKVKYYTCYVDQRGYNRIEVDGQTLKLYRFILGIYDENIAVDHKIDKGNDCKSNLRITNQTNNAKNLPKSANRSSIYLGVSKRNGYDKWIVSVSYNNKSKIIGVYEEEEDAGRARDLYILLILKNEFYRLNFEWDNNDIEEHRYLIAKYLDD